MTDRRISATTITAVIVASVAGLIAKVLLQYRLTDSGYDLDVARNLSYLIVPVVMGVLLAPLWRTEKAFLKDQFRFSNLSWRLIWQAIAIGVLLRIAWWAHLIASVSFGFVQSSGENAIVGPVFSFQCPTAPVFALGFIVMAMMVPLIEEVVHRAYVMTALHRRSVVTAVFVSALVFAIFHRPETIPFAFCAGIVFGIQYWLTRSLWASLLSHATVNGLIRFDWICFSGQWNPLASDTPLLLPGFVASAALVVSVLLIAWLLRAMAAGVTRTPAAPP